MTTHDRGAYTPQPDAPLQFDARGPRSRRPMPMTLIGSGAVLIVLLGALALHYRQDTKADAPRPVGEPLGQVKTAPPAEAQPKASVEGVDVFNGENAQVAKAPTFAPAPEPPKPRPQLTVQAVDPLTVPPKPIPATKAAAVATAAAAPVSTAPTPTTQASTTLAYKAPAAATVRPDATSVIDKVAAEPAKTTSAKVAATLPVKPTTTAPTVAKATTTLVKAAAGGAAVVQIGAFSSTGQSDKGWSDVSAAMAGEMAGKTKRVETLEKDGKTLYRTSVVGFASRVTADAFCATLKAKGKICIVKS